MKENNKIWYVFFALIWWATGARGDFVLLNKVCVVIKDEPPVLLSQIENLKQQKGISFKESEKELIQQRLMWVYVRKNPLRYNIANIYGQVDEHINEVMEKNKLTKEKFIEILMKEPYLTTFSQYRFDAATATLENFIKSFIASQVSISEGELREAKQDLAHQYDIVLVSVLKGQGLSAQIKKANEIHAQIVHLGSLDKVKERYGHDKNISITGPYEEGALKSVYKNELKATPGIVTKPFKDEDSVTIIWKLKKNLDEEALLEKVRKRLYETAVEEQFNSLTNSVRDGSTDVVKNCKER